MLRRVAFEKVMKFGGAALKDGPAVERVCAIVRGFGGNRPVVVVSAHQGVTNLLDAVARAAADGEVDRDKVRIRHRSLLRELRLDSELLDRYFAELASILLGIAQRRRLSPDERDLVLSYGERMSARIVAHALKNLDVPATPVDAYDLGLVSDSNHGAARPLLESRDGVRAALLEVPGVPVVTGFLAKDRNGNLTTLGRNGSDLSAALLAEAVGARSLELWKSVGGVMTADPAIVPESRVIRRMSFEDAALLASHGAEVLHPDALEPALRAGIAVRFRDVRDPSDPGTELESRAADEGPVGIAVRRSFREGSGELPNESGELTRDRALVAIVGRGDFGARALESLLEIGLRPIEARIGAEHASQIFVVRADEVERAAKTVHAACFEREGSRIP
jgi:aspartate kinase